MTLDGSSSVFSRNRGQVMAALASGMGASPEAFLSEQLAIVDRPAATPWFTAMVATFGTGTVISIDPAYRALVETTPPRPHYRAHYPGYLRAILDEGSRRSQPLTASSPSILWTLSRLPHDPTVPAGFTLRTLDASWMNAEMANARFENGVGEPGVAARDIRNRFALALFDSHGNPVAVGGAFDTFGLLEIGVDVVRQHRGKGFGRVVVEAAAREIVSRGQTPLYGCAATNIRSQHTALGTGFLPVASDVFVVPAAGLQSADA